MVLHRGYTQRSDRKDEAGDLNTGDHGSENVHKTNRLTVGGFRSVIPVHKWRRLDCDASKKTELNKSTASSIRTGVASLEGKLQATCRRAVIKSCRYCSSQTPFAEIRLKKTYI